MDTFRSATAELSVRGGSGAAAEATVAGRGGPIEAALAAAPGITCTHSGIRRRFVGRSSILGSCASALRVRPTGTSNDMSAAAAPNVKETASDVKEVGWWLRHARVSHDFRR